VAVYLTNDGALLTEILLEALQNLLEKPELIRSVCFPPAFKWKSLCASDPTYQSYPRFTESQSSCGLLAAAARSNAKMRV
jgi:hypothetical protein